eukprot:2815764-Prymnesium_polylepis.1
MLYLRELLAALPQELSRLLSDKVIRQAAAAVQPPSPTHRSCACRVLHDTGRRGCGQGGQEVRAHEGARRDGGWAIEPGVADAARENWWERSLSDDFWRGGGRGQ